MLFSAVIRALTLGRRRTRVKRHSPSHPSPA
jgi:hypothetical protein